MLANQDDINQLIGVQNRSKRRHLFFALGVATIGLVFIVVNNQFPGLFIPEVSKSMVGLGTTFVSLLGSGIPMLQFLKCIDRIEHLQLLKTKITALQDQTTGEEDRKRIDSLLWQAIEKGVVG